MRWAALIVLLIGVGAAMLVQRYEIDRRLIQMGPDAIPGDPELYRHARTRGRPVFIAHCAACHGSTGRGDSTQGVPDLTDHDWLYGAGLISDIERVVTYGIRSHNPKAWNLAAMPAYATSQPSASNVKIPPLTPRELADVVEYLLFRQGSRADSGAVPRGGAVYDRAGCYDCHATDLRGDSAIGAPDLTDGITLYGNGSRESLLRSISDGRQGECPDWIRVIEPSAIRAVAVYVFSLSEPR